MKNRHTTKIAIDIVSNGRVKHFEINNRQRIMTLREKVEKIIDEQYGNAVASVSNTYEFIDFCSVDGMTVEQVNKHIKENNIPSTATFQSDLDSVELQWGVERELPHGRKIEAIAREFLALVRKHVYSSKDMTSEMKSVIDETTYGLTSLYFYDLYKENKQMLLDLLCKSYGAVEII